MKKFSVVFSAFMLLLGLSGIAGAYTIDYAYTASASGNNFQSNYDGDPGFITEYFNGGTLGILPVGGVTITFKWEGDGRVAQNDSVPAGEYSAPMGVDGINKDKTKFLTVPTNLTAPNSVTAKNLGGTYNYFGIWWGSVDYAGTNDINNVLKFYLGDTLVQTITGADAIYPNVPNGNQTAPETNLYVNFYDLPLFDNFKMSSNKFAFEADNITVGVVPEPGTMMLLGSGLAGLVGYGRRRFKK